MLKTGLPYDIDLMNNIAEHGAIVDMSSLKFPGIDKDKQIYTALIFLKNTGFDVTLDFSQCSFKEKEEYLLLYLQKDVSIKNPEFAKTWIEILLTELTLEIEMQGFLAPEEIKLFIKRNQDSYISNIKSFIASLPVYAMYRYYLNDKAYTLNDIKHSDYSQISNNICKLFAMYPEEIMFIFSTIEKEPVFYEKLFTVENNELFDSLQNLPFFQLLYGLTIKDKEEWKQILMLSESTKETQ